MTLINPKVVGGAQCQELLWLKTKARRENHASVEELWLEDGALVLIVLNLWRLHFLLLQGGGLNALNASKL